MCLLNHGHLALHRNGHVDNLVQELHLWNLHGLHRWYLPLLRKWNVRHCIDELSLWNPPRFSAQLELLEPASAFSRNRRPSC